MEKVHCVLIFYGVNIKQEISMFDSPRGDLAIKDELLDHQELSSARRGILITKKRRIADTLFRIKRSRRNSHIEMKVTGI